tara:strand:- start:630 stop:1073 length:444 start_codon:yes stop_codon:yes gene_type:complete
MVKEDTKWMNIAIIEALKAESKGEIPVGAVIVKDNKIIASGHNEPISKNDPTAHAEIKVIRQAGKKLKNYRLMGTTLYVTLEPCSMCFGAIMHARIDRIVFGAYDFKGGACDSYSDLKIFNHKVIITGGILESNCREILHSFFKQRR